MRDDTGSTGITDADLLQTRQTGTNVVATGDMNKPKPHLNSRFHVRSARLFRHLQSHATLKTLRTQPVNIGQPLVFCLLVAATPWVNADAYRYKQPDGGVIFTDVKLPPGESRTVSISNIGSHRGYRSSYGRPTATASCTGVSPHLLDTRYSSIAGAVEAAAAEFNVDPLLIRAISRVESCYDSSAISSAGARGIMQLMPATAREMSVKNSFDPVANVRGGTKYISWLLDRYDGDKELALAAYNAGPGAVDKHGGIPPYRETMDYVPKVLKYFTEFSRKPNLATR